MQLSSAMEDRVSPMKNGILASIRILIGGWIVCCLGCAQWAPDDEGRRSATAGLPPARIADEASVIDIIFWPLPDDKNSGLQQSDSDDPIAMLWEEVDELAIPVDVRNALLDNGLRAGKVQHIEQILKRFGLPDPHDEATHLLREVSVDSDIAHSRHTIPFRDGEIQHLAIRQTQSDAPAVMVRFGEETIGKRLPQPQFLYSVQARSSDDGRVHIRMWPKIEFGEFRQSYVSSDQAIRIDSARDAWTLHELTTEALLGKNETLIVTATPRTFGLGKRMLTSSRADGSRERVAILVRVSRLPQPQL